LTTDYVTAGPSGSTLWISIANGIISRILPLAAAPAISVSNLSLWLSPSSIVTNASGVVTQWTDNSSQQNNAQANVAPLYAANGFGAGHPALQFLGTNYMTLAAPQSRVFTMFIVCSAASYPTVTDMEPLTVPHSTNWANPYAELFFRYNDASANYLAFLWGATLPVTGSFNPSLGVTNIFAFVVNPNGTYVMYDKGVPIGSGTAPPLELPTQPYLYLGGFPTADDLLTGNISEVIRYERALSPQEITNVTWYLGTNNNVPTPGITAPATVAPTPVNLAGTFTGTFAGSGSGLTNLQSANIVGSFGAITARTYTGTQLAIPSSMIDWSAGSYQYQTITTNAAYVFTNSANAMTLQVAIANTGNYKVTWPAMVKWSGGAAPIQTSGNHTDVYSFVQINGTVYGNVVQNY
jgi:hypothetical protein